MNASYPYPPQASQALPPEPFRPLGGANGEPQFWTPTELVGSAWARYKNHAGLFFAAAIVFCIVVLPLPYSPLILQATGTLSPNSVEFHAFNLGQSLVFLVLNAYLLSGFTRMCVMVAKGEAPGFGTFFAGRGFLGVLAFQFMISLPTLLASSITLVGAAIDVPLLSLVGVAINALSMFGLVFVWLAFGQTPALIVDKRLGFFEAMRQSAAITRGHRANIFVVGLLATLVCVAGAFACGIGMFVSGPLFYVILAVLYVRLTGQDPNGMSMTPGHANGPYASYPQGAVYVPPGGGAAPPAGGYGTPY